jgi:prepilin-type N-terminal cleavage/methylation domain-containing protein
MPTIKPRSTSNADRRYGERGASFIEMMVAMTIMLVVSAIYYSLFIGTMDVNTFLESHNDLTTIGQRSVNVIKDEVSQSRLLYQEDTLGQSYLAVMVLPSLWPKLSGSLLPIIDPDGVIQPDGGTRRVGNSLLVVREELPLSIWIDHDSDINSPDVEFLVDLLRLEYFYLAYNYGRSFTNSGYYLDLIQARSVVYADYFQLTGLTPAVCQLVAVDLNSQGITTAWDPTLTADQAFFSILPSGALNGPVSASIDMSDSSSLMPEFRGGRIQGSIEYSVGLHANPPLTTEDPVNLFAQKSGDFPSGFETLVVGPSATRRVFSRLVLVSEHKGKFNSTANTVISTTAEF